MLMLLFTDSLIAIMASHLDCAGLVNDLYCCSSSKAWNSMHSSFVNSILALKLISIDFLTHHIMITGFSYVAPCDLEPIMNFD